MGARSFCGTRSPDGGLVGRMDVEGRHLLDGERVDPEQGPGIVQYLAVPAGAHRLEGRYRPPGLPAAGFVTVLAGVVVAAFFSRSSSWGGSGRR